MKQFAAILAIGALAALPAMAVITTPHVAGSFQGWNPGSHPMTETFPGSGIYTLTVTNLSPGRYEYKITDGTWANNYPGPNSWFYVGSSGTITLSYDINTYADGWSPTIERLGQSTDPGAWTAVGNWQSLVGGSNWTNNDPVTAMTPMGGGIYKYMATLPPGTYDWKPVVTGTWDSISWDNRSVHTANWSFTTDAVNNTVVFWVNQYAGTAKVEVIPEPAALALAALGLLLRRR